jgi:Na+-transporting NADH:ubiquinone oxidoreductase subunit C
MADQSAGKTVVVALSIAIGCSLLVSVTAVGLADRQQANRDLDLMKNVLLAAGLYDPNESVVETFSRIELQIVDLETGAYVTSEEIGQGTYSQREARSDPLLSVAIPQAQDVASLGRREKYSYVGLIREAGRLDQIVFPVRGTGLWSTMYAFVALDGDLNTVRGLAFYEHGETAGLGGEINNPRWLALWPGKKVHDDQGDLRIRVIKGAVNRDSPDARYQVDGLSGATITADGVTHLMHYWFGDHGFGPYLDRLRNEGADHG